jgi:hypothetical protein
MVRGLVLAVGLWMGFLMKVMVMGKQGAIWEEEEVGLRGGLWWVLVLGREGRGYW